MYADSKIGLKTFAGKYLSAQPNGRLEANRDHFKAWEMFEVVFLDVKTCLNGNFIFSFVSFLISTVLTLVDVAS